jgi:hypothetical protein
MSNDILPAKSSPPRKATNRFGGLDTLHFQRLMSAFPCPPKTRQFGGLKAILYQLVMPASRTPRLATCVRFRGHAVDANKKRRTREKRDRLLGGNAVEPKTRSITTGAVTASVAALAPPTTTGGILESPRRQPCQRI